MKILTNEKVPTGTTDVYDKYYPYEELEEALIKEGYDVIVFVPSKDEDESKITCGNAILAKKRKATR